MKVIDVNVLLYAVNEASEAHAKVHRWWQRALTGDESIGLPWLVIAGFLRISTNPRVYPQPLTVNQALDEVAVWLSTSVGTPIAEKADHWPALRDILLNTGTAGNLTTDAHLATLAITHDATLVSCDTDFARFAGLRWENPLKAVSRR